MSEPRDPHVDLPSTIKAIAVRRAAGGVVSAEMRIAEAQGARMAALRAWGEAVGVDDPGDGYEALWASRVKGSGGAS